MHVHEARMGQQQSVLEDVEEAAEVLSTISGKLVLWIFSGFSSLCESNETLLCVMPPIQFGFKLHRISFLMG